MGAARSRAFFTGRATCVAVTVHRSSTSTQRSPPLLGLTIRSRTQPAQLIGLQHFLADSSLMLTVPYHTTAGNYITTLGYYDSSDVTLSSECVTALTSPQGRLPGLKTDPKYRASHVKPSPLQSTLSTSRGQSRAIVKFNIGAF